MQERCDMGGDEEKRSLEDPEDKTVWWIGGDMESSREGKVGGRWAKLPSQTWRHGGQLHIQLIILIVVPFFSSGFYALE